MYSFSNRVRYSEVNSEKELTLPSLLDYLQDCCTFESEDFGVGVDYLAKEQVAWILSSWEIKVYRYPQMGQHIKVSTWPYAFRGFYGYRNFRIEGEDGEIFAEANSVWVFMDTEEMRPARVSERMQEVYIPEIRDEIPGEWADRKISLPDEAVQKSVEKEPVRVSRFYIDTNHHMNNGKYILVDKLNPREFSEVADVDLDLCRVLYQFYALENEQYSAFMKNLEDYRVSIIDMVDFIYEQKEKGGIDFDDDKSEEIDDLHQQICDAREQLEGDKYDRMVFTLKGAVEGAETFAVVDEIRDMVKEYYDESYVVGDATSNEELSNSFQKDNIMISVLTALFVWAILLFTFQNAGLPFLLVLTIQGSIWINFAIPYVTNDKMYFLSYLIVSSIQMGATIDYAIVITSRYMAIRKEIADRKAAIIETLNEAFPTIITSGTMMVCAGFVIGALTSNATIASLGKTLGRGALISIVLVMSVLPQLLLVGDKLIDKAELTRSSKRGQEKEEASES